MKLYTHTHGYSLKDNEENRDYSNVERKTKNNKRTRLVVPLILMLIVISAIAIIGINLKDNGIEEIANNLKEKINGETTSIDENTENSVSGEENKETNPSKVTIAEDGAIVCDSIVQGVRDSELENGTYTFRVIGNINGTNESKDYKVELINYYDDVTYELSSGRTVSLGDSSKEYKMLAVKYHKNLTIGSGVTLTATTVSNLTYKKGMYICVNGELKNYGEISMTARGTYNQEGENVFLWKNVNSSYEYVPAVGGEGGASAVLPGRTGNYSQSKYGRTGEDGSNRSTGGGGSGAAYGGYYSGPGIKSGEGSTGTSYSGGSGSGAIISQNQDQEWSWSTEKAGENGGRRK